MKPTRGVFFVLGLVFFAMAVKARIVGLPFWVIVGFITAIAMVGGLLTAMPLRLNENEKKVLIAGYGAGALIGVAASALLLLLIAQHSGGIAIVTAAAR